MSQHVQSFLKAKQRWQMAYDELLRFGSEGIMEAEILEAKEIFFARLGRSHEMKEDLYESASLSFLEWYLWEYPTKRFGKSPLAVVLTLHQCDKDMEQVLERSLHQHWSLFRVKAIDDESIDLEDLLFGKQKKFETISRKVTYDRESTEAKLWKLKPGQIVQCRLFPLEDGHHFFSHLWIHPEPENAVLKKLCDKRRRLWGLHRDFLLSSFEAVIRSYGVQNQIQVSQGSNWIYQELYKRYAKAA